MDVNAARPDVPMMTQPTVADGDRAARDARALFARTLAGWSSDLLVLRRASLDRPTWASTTDDRGPALAA